MTETSYTTSNTGVPLPSDEHSLTQGPGGGIMLHDWQLIEKMAQFNRERVPERVVHAKGGGAFGEFRVTGDVSRYTRAKVFQPGAVTPMLARFSSVAGEHGSPDTWRDSPRVRAEVLHRGRQLRHGRQQHAGLLHEGSDEVPGLHPLPEASCRHEFA